MQHPVRPLAGFVLALLLPAVLAGCGGGGSTGSAAPVATAAPAPLTLSTNQSAATVLQGANFRFSATVAGGGGATALEWTVQEGAAGGSITNTGLYTAPMTAGTYHVVVTLQPDRSISRTITVTVPPVRFYTWGGDSPLVVATGAARYLRVSATVGKPAEVDWEVVEGTAGGSISNTTTIVSSDPAASATYTAPAATGTYHVRVRLLSDPSTFGTFIVQVVDRGFRPLSTPSTGPVTYWNTSTLLRDGRALLAGGDRRCSSPAAVGDCPTDAAQIYDPRLNTFTATGRMREARVRHTATRLADGRVLLVGGTTLRAASSPSSYQTSATAEIYDPESGGFTATGSMSVPRSGHVATLLADGRVLVTGGWGAYNSPGSAEIYDPRTGAFSDARPMRSGRSSHAAALLPDGRVLLVGGGGKLAELFDPASNAFSETGALQDFRDHAAIVVRANGEVLIVGGGRYTVDDEFIPAFGVERYDPATGSFTALGNLSEGHHDHAAVELSDGKVLLAGGWTQTAEIFDPASRTSIPTGGTAHVLFGNQIAVLPDGRVTFVGSNGTDAAEVFR